FAANTAVACIQAEDHGARLAATFAHAENGGFATRATAQVHLLIGVLIRLLAAKVGLIGFHDPGQRPHVHAALATSLTDALQHEPCGLLSDAEFLGNLHRGNAL